MAGKTARDVGTVINRLARFAAGAGFAGDTAQGLATGGVADAGTSASIGERLKGGFSAISEPFRDVQKTQSQIGLQAAQSNRLNALAATERLATEAANKPFDISSLIGGVDPTGTLSQKIQPILQQAGIDKDGNGIVTNAELQEGIRSGNIDLSQISGAVSDTVKGIDKQSQVNAAAIQKRKEKLALAVPGLGVDFTDEEFLNNPTLVSMDKELASLMNRQQSTNKQKDLFASKIGMIDKFQKEQEARNLAAQSPAQRRFGTISKRETNEALGEADDLIAAIERNEITDITVEDVINEIEFRFPTIGDEVRSRLRTGKKLTGLRFD